MGRSVKIFVVCGVNCFSSYYDVIPGRNFIIACMKIYKTMFMVCVCV